jgi:hypothetical protein
VVTAAALCSLFLGLAFGLPAVFGTLHFAQTGEVWTFMGFPTYGNGPFDRIGLPTSTLLLVGFLSMCLAEVALGVLLWAGAPHAPAVSYALLPVEIAFWIGFALPLGPALGIARTVLLLLASPQQSPRNRDVTNHPRESAGNRTSVRLETGERDPATFQIPPHRISMASPDARDPGLQRKANR